MPTIRDPVVAGSFYPNSKDALEHDIRKMLAQVTGLNLKPRALIVPHAGYIYSGAIAASAYKELEPIKHNINRVVLLGPAHHVALMGCAVSSMDYFQTPLGDIRLDRDSIKALTEFPQVQINESAHAQEHSLEVNLPFLQTVLGKFELVPIVVGDCNAMNIMQILDFFWSDPKTSFIISSDLSHFYSYQIAQEMDEKTSDSIINLRPEEIRAKQACGRNPIVGLLELAKKHGLRARKLDLRNSGDTAGNKNQVVGYGAYGFY